VTEARRIFSGIQPLPIDGDEITEMLWRLLAIPSPTGYTDSIVHTVADILAEIGVEFEITRRGAIRVNLYGAKSSPDRALIGHLDTLGCQVASLKDNGRLMIVPIGTWSARFAEGARVTVFSSSGPKRGTILPLRASGHRYHDEVDTLPIGWDYVELRLDEMVSSAQDLEMLGVHVGDIVGVDSVPELSGSGYINSRHLDDKAGVAAMLVALRRIVRDDVPLPVDCHFLFTISEEVGSGASAVLHGDVAELVAVDNGVQAPDQNTSEFGMTVCVADQTGPFDWHLTQHVLGLARRFGISHRRDVFRYYRCDAASAVEAGNDIRTALITFGVDASHGYERTHIDALISIARMITIYVQSEPCIPRDRMDLGPVEGFPEQPID
jgi:peptidase M42 family hydrolase